MAERDFVAAALDLADRARPRRVLCHGPRGAGRSWWLDAAVTAAQAGGCVVARAAGAPARRDLALGGLAALLAPLADVVDGLGDDGLLLRQALDGRGTADATAVKLATLRAVAAAADRRPLCLAVDDIDQLDSSSRDVLDAVLDRCTADPIVLLATAVAPSAFPADAAVRLEPLGEHEIAAVLARRGVAAAPAARCAVAASGNPGVAVAMADALSEAQRAGEEPVPDLPRLGGPLAAELQARMRSLGEPCCRALVVAAAAADGDLGAVGGALAHLGEPGVEALEPAEEAGVVELVGRRVVFPDPFTRHAAYHLLAPASRRAAHRALAAQFSEPHEAPARVWHLVGAVAGPSDSVAEALELVAADALRRGATATAASTYERAVELAASTEVRERALAAAVGAALETGDLTRAERLIAGRSARSAELRAAFAETAELRTGRSTGGDDLGDGAGAQRLADRRSAWMAAAAGDHRAVLALLGERPRHAADAVPAAVALRHAGRTREARDLLASVEVDRSATGSFLHRWWAVAHADLEVLAGRSPDEALLAVPATMPDWLRADAAAVAARARLATDLSISLVTVPAAFAAGDAEPLASVRAGLGSAIAAGDAVALDAVIALAESHRLPVEVGEARLWQAELRRAAGDPSAGEGAGLAQATLHRCSVRGWDARLAAVARAADGPAPVADPALAALSKAERRVADAVAEGMTNREAAAALFLSVKTVDFHLQQIYRKLAVRSRTELAVRLAGGGPRVGVGLDRGRGA